MIDFQDTLRSTICRITSAQQSPKSRIYGDLPILVSGHAPDNGAFDSTLERISNISALLMLAK